MQISLSDFLKKKTIVSENHVICFKGDEYQFLFFSLLFNYLRKSEKINISFINNHEINLDELKLNFEQTFLGSNLFYWCNNISEQKKLKEFISYFESYNGPHVISFFIDEDQFKKYESNLNKKILTVQCDYINFNQISDLLILWPQEKHDLIIRFIKKIFETNNQLSLDQFCIFVNYALFLGTRYNQFLDEWLKKILINEQSLFTLSKYFFSKDSKLFFNCWDSMSQNYAPVFWTSFWSEQLYRAFNFVDLRNNGKHADARQIAFKLPFSFIQNDWKKSSSNELKFAHQFIYQMDYSLKNGGSEIFFDLFYAKFFQNNFKNI